MAESNTKKRMDRDKSTSNSSLEEDQLEKIESDQVPTKLSKQQRGDHLAKIKIPSEEKEESWSSPKSKLPQTVLRRQRLVIKSDSIDLSAASIGKVGLHYELPNSSATISSAYTPSVSRPSSNEAESQNPRSGDEYVHKFDTGIADSLQPSGGKKSVEMPDQSSGGSSHCSRAKNRKVCNNDQTIQPFTACSEVQSDEYDMDKTLVADERFSDENIVENELEFTLDDLKLNLPPSPESSYYTTNDSGSDDSTMHCPSDDEDNQHLMPPPPSCNDENNSDLSLPTIRKDSPMPNIRKDSPMPTTVSLHRSKLSMPTTELPHWPDLSSVTMQPYNPNLTLPSTEHVQWPYFAPANVRPYNTNLSLRTTVCQYGSGPSPPTKHDPGQSQPFIHRHGNKLSLPSAKVGPVYSTEYEYNSQLPSFTTAGQPLPSQHAAEFLESQSQPLSCPGNQYEKTSVPQPCSEQWKTFALRHGTYTNIEPDDKGDTGSTSMREIVQELPVKKAKTPLDLAISVQKCCVVFYTLCHGLLGGMALLQMMMAFSIGSSLPEMTKFVEVYSMLASFANAMFSFLVLVCVVSVFDKYDLRTWWSYNFLSYLRWKKMGIIIVMVYVVTMIINAVAACADNRLALQPYNSELWGNTEMKEALSYWQMLTLFRCIGAVLGWILITLFPNSNALLNWLEALSGAH